MARKRSAATATRNTTCAAQLTAEREPTKLEPKTDKLYTGSSDLIPEIRLEFPHLFEVQVLKEISGRGAELRYFPAARHQGCDGVLLQVTSEDAAPWSGLFAAQPSGQYRSGVYSCPDPNALCIVSNGAGYVLDVRDPDGYQEIPISPVLDVVPGIDAGLLVLANYTDVLAWGRSGRRWLAERVSFDGIRNLQIEGGVLRGLVWSPVDGERSFVLDLATGTPRPSG